MDNHVVSRRVAALLAIAALLLLPAVSCRAADETTQTRSLASFDKIRLEGAFGAEIIAGARRSRIVIRGDADAVDRVTTGITDGTLVVGVRHGNADLKSLPKLEISVAVLRSFQNDGAASVKIVGLAGGDVAIGCAGAGTIAAAGRAASLKISLDGTGKIDTTAVDAHDVAVENNGVGGIYVRASGSLTMDVNGVGEIRYAGNPAHIESHVNGVGRTSRI